jgi:hypothetical protein
MTSPFVPIAVEDDAKWVGDFTIGAAAIKGGSLDVAAWKKSTGNTVWQGCVASKDFSQAQPPVQHPDSTWWRTWQLSGGGSDGRVCQSCSSRLVAANVAPTALFSHVYIEIGVDVDGGDDVYDGEVDVDRMSPA